MQRDVNSIAEYIDDIEPEWLDLFNLIYRTLKKSIPSEFKEELSYKMIGFVVPHSIYPKGYHVTPELPLPFVNLAVQKNSVNIYHMSLYSDKKLLEWFTTKYKEIVGKKPNMGKSCIRFKKESDFPVELFEALFNKISVEDYIKNYERQIKEN